MEMDVSVLLLRLVTNNMYLNPNATADVTIFQYSENWHSEFLRKFEDAGELADIKNKGDIFQYSLAVLMDKGSTKI